MTAKTAKSQPADAVTAAPDRSSTRLSNRPAQVTDSDIVGRANDVYLAGRIEALLARIRPLFEADGVQVELVDVRDRSVRIRFTGSAVHCATAPLNLQTGLEEIFRHEIEGFGELRLDLN